VVLRCTLRYSCSPFKLFATQNIQQDRQCNTEARSRNHCCLENISVCVFVRERARARARERVVKCVFLRVRVCGCACVCRSRAVLRACSLTNPACIAPLYCQLRLVWFHCIFGYYHINRTIFGEKLFNTKCEFWFSLHLLFQIFLILNIIQRDIVINFETSSYKAHTSFLSDFNKTLIF
jgi:hypothetical protein